VFAQGLGGEEYPVVLIFVVECSLELAYTSGDGCEIIVISDGHKCGANKMTGSLKADIGADMEGCNPKEKAHPDQEMDRKTRGQSRGLHFYDALRRGNCFLLVEN
jgi:hypothetical protein